MVVYLRDAISRRHVRLHRSILDMPIPVSGRPSSANASLAEAPRYPDLAGGTHCL